MDIKQKIYWLIQAGIDSFCCETPCHKETGVADSQVVSSDTPATQQAQAFAIQADSLEHLNQQKKGFSLCSLSKTATHTLLGKGIVQPKLMCIMEMPDADSDKTGQCLAGAQGELFTKMMKAIHLDVDKDIYVTYLSPWRTPGNRALSEQESALFVPFLKKEIQLLQPEKILLFGSGVASALFGPTTLAKARGAWHAFEQIPTRVTLSLNAVKTTPQRKQAWDDLQQVEKLS